YGNGDEVVKVSNGFEAVVKSEEGVERIWLLTNS
ncbi:hypothetical protein Tco_1332227, partial [Tanacetum coccineum]